MPDKPEDGGQVFPLTLDENTLQMQGISLRDAIAFVVLVANRIRGGLPIIDRNAADDAERAYETADAMIKRRKR